MFPVRVLVIIFSWIGRKCDEVVGTIECSTVQKLAGYVQGRASRVFLSRQLLAKEFVLVRDGWSKGRASSAIIYPRYSTVHSTYSVSTHTYLQNEAKRARSMIRFTRHVRMCRHGVYLSDILRCRTPTSLSSMDVIKQEHATLANQSTLSAIRQPLLPLPPPLPLVISTDSFPTFPPLLPSLRHVPIIHPRRRDLQRLFVHPTSAFAHKFPFRSDHATLHPNLTPIPLSPLQV